MIPTMSPSPVLVVGDARLLIHYNAIVSLHKDDLEMGGATLKSLWPLSFGYALIINQNLELHEFRNLSRLPTHPSVTFPISRMFKDAFLNIFS